MTNDHKTKTAEKNPVSDTWCDRASFKRFLLGQNILSQQEKLFRQLGTIKPD
ncbi:hypothetical protein [Oscillatoria sp. HE19RPO]|uniref:hypothetical protein n=1 Tax=Oscillatoria sp. HE19RPO TaxID=2954806 RepID=UPI0020C46345|nr:hypothetical protein [Oscillatoria sp. HE19RPO]